MNLFSFGLFIGNFEQISLILLVFLLLTLEKYVPVGQQFKQSENVFHQNGIAWMIALWNGRMYKYVYLFTKHSDNLSIQKVDCTHWDLSAKMASILRTVFLISFEYTAQKMKFSIKDLFSKCDQIRSFLRI